MTNLIDPFEREINYLRLSVTEDVISGVYCMSENMQFLPKNLLTLEELDYMCSTFIKSV